VKKLIENIQSLFIDKLGITFILTTHSPTTVALAPEGSIFRLKNENETTLEKISKDEALKDLTFGIPNLSIDYKNHRQVFVESETDLNYYQAIYNLYKQSSNNSHQLYFIAAGMGKSNCEEVVDLNKKLHAAGNKNIRGIIDWDLSNKGSEFVKVHGENNNYSIENFLFNPAYLCTLLFTKKFYPALKACNFADTENEYLLIADHRAKLAVDYITTELQKRFPAIKELDQNRTQVTFQGGANLVLPKWYCTIQGHELKEKLFEAIPILKSLYKVTEYQIEKDLVKIICKTYPNLPTDTILLFDSLTK
jgi:uncharacterized pyridoxamine 5'-phosphate oxidase family protein